MAAPPRPEARVLYWSLTGHSARLAAQVAADLGTVAEAVRVPAYEGPLRMLRMAADFPLLRTPAPDPPAPGLADAGCVVLCGPVWGRRAAPALRAMLALPDLPPRVGLALTCQDARSSDPAIRCAEADLGRAFHAVLVLENREEDREVEGPRIAEFVAQLVP